MSKRRRIILRCVVAILLLPVISLLAWSLPFPSHHDGHYIPRNLDDAHAELMKLLPPDELQRIRDMKSEFDMIDYHFGLGMGLRNDWGLWRGSRLSRRLNFMGIWHPDNMSGVILQSFWCKLHNQPFQLQNQEARFRAYLDTRNK